MKKYKMINFLKEEKEEEKYFKCTVIILIYLLIFQTYTNVTSINNLVDEINNTRLLNKSKMITPIENKKSNLVKDTEKVYDLLGVSNIDRLTIENNKVRIEGRCKSLKVLDKLKSMDNIRDFSIKSVENKNNKLYFDAVYDVGGVE